METSRKLTLETRKLNLLMATFLPVTALTSAFGMNLTSGFEFTSSWPFWAVLAFGVVLGLWVRRSIDSDSPEKK